MRFRLPAALAVAALVGPVGQSEARAWFRFTNKTAKPVYVAFVRYKPGCEGGVPWEKRGWWRLDPGQTKTVQGDAISNRYSYYYAESEDRTWLWTSAGPNACLPQPAFTWCWNTCNNSPTTRWLGVRLVDAGSSSDYTVNLTPPQTGPQGSGAAGEDPTQGRDAAPGGAGEVDAPASAGPGGGPPAAPGGGIDPMGGAGPDDPMSGPDPAPPAAAPKHGAKPTQASPHAIIVQQPDGSNVALHIRGGPAHNWHEDLNGYPVVRAPDGRYVYAAVGPGGELKPTNLAVGKADPAAAGVKKGPSTAATGAAPQGADPMGDPGMGPVEDPMQGDATTGEQAEGQRTTERLPASGPAGAKGGETAPDPMSSGSGQGCCGER